MSGTTSPHDTGLIPEQVEQDSEIETGPTIPPFEPLFTLLTNSTTNTTVHPRIHYLFSDDDPSVLANTSDRALVVDLEPAPEGDPGRWAVSWAASLTSDFAVTKSHVAVQQSEGDDQGSLMLRVEGVEREAVEMPRQERAAGSGSISPEQREDTDLLAEEFKRRMTVLKTVVEEGERRKVVGVERDEEAVVDDDDAKET